MNANDEVKKYQSIRRKARELAKDIQPAAVPLLQQVQDISRLASELPFDIVNRRQQIANFVAAVVEDIEALSIQLETLNVDCNMQIQRIVTLEQIKKAREEIQNEKRSHTKVVRRPRNKRKSGNRKKSPRRQA